MPEPGLSEIVNMTVDPERGSGNPAVVYDSKPLVAQLNQAAQYKAENDWRKYNMFLGNLKDVYKDMNEIAKMPVMTKDRDALKEQMAGIVKSIASDPHGFFGGGAKYQETLANISKLQSDATESKQNNLYDEAHRNYFYRNPELDTQENRALVDGYVNQKLGSRQPYLMKLPGLFDPAAIGEEINNIIQKESTSESLSPDGMYFDKTTTTSYSPDDFDKLAKQFYYQSDKRGIPLPETMSKRYQTLPESAKQKYAGSEDPVLEFYLDTLRPRRKQDKVVNDKQYNQGYLEKEKLAEEKRKANLMASVQRDGNYAELIKAGYVPDESHAGGWRYEGKGLAAGGGAPTSIQYWDNFIKKQLPDKEQGFNGDVEMLTDQISGLSVALEGENSTEEGKGIGLFNPKNKPQKIKVRYKNGVAQGVVIGGIYVNSDDFDVKANQIRNKSMANRSMDVDPLTGNVNTNPTTISGVPVTDPNLLKQLNGQ